MKLALCTTTINVPKVLSLYRKCRDDVRFFVAGDHKTPLEAQLFCEQLSNTRYIGPAEQLRWKCSSLLGWNNDSRRNIALLEALEWGAEIIVSVDDDMIPLDTQFFQHFEGIFLRPFYGLQVGAPGYWLDTGAFTTPTAPARGLPVGYFSEPAISFAVDARIGVAQGIILGIPDSDAMTHITRAPVVSNVHEILKVGFVAEPSCYTVFNSQITAVRREFVPAWAQFYQAEGRNTDILASMIVRRIMREHGAYTHFGQPMGYHARNPHNHLHDLKKEIQGLDLIALLAFELDDWQPSDSGVVEALRDFYSTSKVLPPAAREAALAWCEDCEAIL